MEQLWLMGARKMTNPAGQTQLTMFSKKTDIVTVFSDARSPPAIAQKCNSLHACRKPQLWLKTRVPKQTTYFGPPRIIQFRVVNHFWSYFPPNIASLVSDGIQLRNLVILIRSGIFSPGFFIWCSFTPSGVRVEWGVHPSQWRVPPLNPPHMGGRVYWTNPNSVPFVWTNHSEMIIHVHFLILPKKKNIRA